MRVGTRPARIRADSDQTLTRIAAMDIGVYDAKARFSELVRAVEAGGEVTITRHGRPVARLVPVAPPEAAGAEWAERVRALRREIGHVATGEEIVEWIREGRERR